MGWHFAATIVPPLGIQGLRSAFKSSVSGGFDHENRGPRPRSETPRGPVHVTHFGVACEGVDFRTKCPGPELNQRHADFQSAALPTELPGRLGGEIYISAPVLATLRCHL